jgi:chromosome segregation ATPase
MTDPKKQHTEEQEPSLEEPTREAEETEPKRDSLDEQYERLKETTEKIWDSTRQVFTSATHKASQYKKIVQKKIDLAAIHKKISGSHAELGKLIDDLREEGKKSIMTQPAVKQILARLDDLKAEAMELERELEQTQKEESQAQDNENPQTPE